MIQPTQTMECTTEAPYISIYDKPKRPRGKPNTCTLTDEKHNVHEKQILVVTSIITNTVYYKNAM